jgi:hypothetical protein
MSQYREEKDSMGPVRIPADMLYGAQTERARQNFPISRQLLTDIVGSRAPGSRRALRLGGLALPRRSGACRGWGTVDNWLFSIIINVSGLVEASSWPRR